MKFRVLLYDIYIKKICSFPIFIRIIELDNVILHYRHINTIINNQKKTYKYILIEKIIFIKL